MVCRNYSKSLVGNDFKRFGVGKAKLVGRTLALMQSKVFGVGFKVIGRLAVLRCKRMGKRADIAYTAALLSTEVAVNQTVVTVGNGKLGVTGAVGIGLCVFKERLVAVINIRRQSKICVGGCGDNVVSVPTAVAVLLKEAVNAVNRASCACTADINGIAL